MGLVGREEELAYFDGLLADASGGASRAVVLLGDAGIGKSALLQEVAARATDHGALVLAGRAAEFEAEVPFGLAVDALDDHMARFPASRLQAVAAGLGAALPSVAARLDDATAQLDTAGPAERFRLHRGLRSLLEHLAREQPLVLILDDVHWADPASVEWILHLLRRPPAGRVLLIVALRPIAPADELLEGLRGMAGGDSRHLGPLDDAAAAELVREVNDPRRRAQITAEAGGNPLYLGELVRATGERLPGSLLAAIGLEVRGLSPAARALIDGAAIVGDPFDLDLAAVAAGLAIADAGVPLDHLSRAGLVRPGDGARSFAFRHPLVRRAVHEASPPGWRLAAHGRLVDALRARGASPVVLAPHVAHSALPGDERAVRDLVAAAAATLDSSPAAAARWYESALRLRPGDPYLYVQLGVAHTSAGRPDAGFDAIQHALSMLDHAPMEVRLPIIVGCVQVEYLLGRHREVIARLETELAAAPPWARAALLLEAAIAAFYLSDPELLARWTQVLSEEPPADDPVVAAGVQVMLAMGALWSGEVEHGLAGLRAATTAFAQLGDAELARRIDLVMILGFQHGTFGRLSEASSILSRGLRVARDTRQDAWLGSLTCLRATLDHNAGPAAARADAEAAEEMFRLSGPRYQLQWALWVRALCLHELGDTTERDRIARESIALVEGIAPSTQSTMGVINVATFDLDDDPARMIDAVLAAGGSDLELAEPAWATWIAVQLVRACLAIGRRADAERWLAWIEARRPLGIPAVPGRILLARAELALAAGEAPRAATLAAEAAASLEEHEFALQVLEAQILQARALAADGARDPAVDLLQQVAASAAAIEALRLHGVAARELRRLGARVAAEARRAADRSAELSEREAQIARLVAAGRSNKQVAAELYLSEKTVENNLSRIYAKLGVRARGELAGVLAG